MGDAIGWDGGLGTSFLVHPARDLAVIVLTQRMFETAQAPAVHKDFNRRPRRGRVTAAASDPQTEQSARRIR